MIRRCIICGAEFSTPPSNNRRTCSPACSSQWRSKQHMGVSNRWSEGVKAAARAAAAKTGNLKNGTAAAMNLPERISIHAPLAGCDDVYARYFRTNFDFQSTHPLRGATPGRSCSAGSSCISIHAPLAGCDSTGSCGWWTGWRISIHAPLAGCDVQKAYNIVKLKISIHAPLAGCDYAKILWSVCNFAISIHAPLAGCDPHRVQRWQSGHKHFNPRTPCGVRPSTSATTTRSRGFQSTHPLRGATAQKSPPPIDSPNFNPRTPCGVRRRVRCLVGSLGEDFNPRTPCGVRLQWGTRTTRP